MSVLIVYSTHKLHQLKKALPLLRDIPVTYMKNIIM